MKNVVLIGASGFVGTAILNELLNRGHKVTAIVRDPAKVTASNPNLKVIQADVTDTDVLIEASKGKDAVISAYNPGWKDRAIRLPVPVRGERLPAWFSKLLASNPRYLLPHIP